MNKKVLAGGLALGALALLIEDKPKKRGNLGTTQDMAIPLDEGPNGGSGDSFAHSLPENPGPQREALILSAVISGDAMIRWSSVVSQEAGHEAIIPVLARALSIGPVGDSWRIICTYPTAQHIANELGAVMLTPKVADLIFLQCDLQLTPLNRPAWVTDGTMAKTSRSIEQSLALDSKVPLDDAGLVANEGKHWVNCGRLYQPMGFHGWDSPAGHLGSKHNGPNYGWNMPPSGKPLQSVGLAHDFGHSDYSQMVVLMSDTIFVDNEAMKTADVLKDPILSKLLSNEGPLPSAVHPDLIGVS